ncbi:DUF397 domain-containing protein [Streptomyces sp. NPDC095613]|uniref:DUF397 domain-containing protein n=1 Tax=Streptomyces sp. NPDC095613 TaxID=3155540 RepID=UPI00332B440E
MSMSELAWFKSSYSSGGSGDCVEVALSIHATGRTGTVHVRDSKVPQGPRLVLAPGAWAGFLSDMPQGRH